MRNVVTSRRRGILDRVWIRSDASWTRLGYSVWRQARVVVPLVTRRVSQWARQRVGWSGAREAAVDHRARHERVGVKRLEVENLALDVPGRRLLVGADFTAGAGECLAVLGPSGVGKTSLLNCVAGISTAASGSVLIDGTELSSLGAAKRSEFRLRHIGMVFQFGELLPELTLLENVALPLRLVDVPRREAERRAMGWLDRLGLGEHVQAHPERLSGGEIQRAGIARALVHEPVLVLADEPTGMLDEENTERVVGLLVETARELGIAVMVATHDPLVASAADRVLRIRDGRLIVADESDRSADARP